MNNVSKYDLDFKKSLKTQLTKGDKKYKFGMVDFYSKNLEFKTFPQRKLQAHRVLPVNSPK